jgi:hypothetical protein
MKTTFKLALLLSIIFLGYSCKKDDNTTSDNNNNSYGTYNATGTITFSADGVNYSCPIAKVITAATSVTVQTSTVDQRTTGSIFVTCYTPSSAVTTGTYTASSSATISSVSFVDKTVTPFSATATTAGSSCTVNITTLTSTSIKGTFTATVVHPLNSSHIIITSGVINCTIGSKE